MELMTVLKSMADETRMKIIKMLLQHNYCVRALSRKLGLSESAISQHLKVLRLAGLVDGEKRGYFKHYAVKRNTLYELASKIGELAAIEREVCNPESAGCKPAEEERCYVQKTENECSDEVQSFCHGDTKKERSS